MTAVTGTLAFALIIVGLILAVLAILMPVFIYDIYKTNRQIRDYLAAVSEKLDIIEPEAFIVSKFFEEKVRRMQPDLVNKPSPDTFKEDIVPTPSTVVICQKCGHKNGRGNRRCTQCSAYL